MSSGQTLTCLDFNFDGLAVANSLDAYVVIWARVVNATTPKTTFYRMHKDYNPTDYRTDDGDALHRNEGANSGGGYAPPSDTLGIL